MKKIKKLVINSKYSLNLQPDSDRNPAKPGHVHAFTSGKSASKYT